MINESKLTERSRAVFSHARQEAQRNNSEFIGTENLLVAILLEGEGVAAKVLKTLNVNLEMLRATVEKEIPAGTSPAVTLGQLPYSPKLKHVMESSEKASETLGHDVIGTEHLLLGIIKESDSVGYKILQAIGLKPDEVRDMILEVLGADITDVLKASPPPPPPLQPEPQVTWKCECCGRSTWWRKPGGMPSNPKVYDRAPFIVTVGETPYSACSQDCARNIYLVKGLGEAFKVFSDFRKEGL